MLHGDAVVDQRQILAQDRPGGGGQRQGALLDERHDGEGGEPLVAAGQREPGGGGVGDAPAPVGPPVRDVELDRAVPLDAHHAREVDLARHLVDGAGQVGHDWSSRGRRGSAGTRRPRGRRARGARRSRRGGTRNRRRGPRPRPPRRPAGRCPRHGRSPPPSCPAARRGPGRPRATFTKPTSSPSRRATTQPRLCAAVSSRQFHSDSSKMRVSKASAWRRFTSSLVKLPRHSKVMPWVASPIGGTLPGRVSAPARDTDRRRRTRGSSRARRRRGSGTGRRRAAAGTP